MVATKLRQPKTYEDYLETPDDGQRYELIDEEIVVSAAPLIDHQRLVGRLFRLLADVGDRSGGEAHVSPTAVTLNSRNTLEPDVCYRSKENPAIVEPGRILGAPDLVVEVISPSTASRDQITKRAIYQEAGVREYWIVEPRSKTVMVLELTENGYRTIRSSGGRIESRAVPGFVVDLNALFAMPHPDSH